MLFFYRRPTFVMNKRHHMSSLDEILAWLSVCSAVQMICIRGPADITATSSSLAPVKSRKVYLSGAGLPKLFWKKGS